CTRRMWLFGYFEFW
nr:immunoglobulin heavy chain junction region [Macaca mulatta]MOW26024.1 immunoglobulin heavy chain junction region [Macaca mulatta]MOW26171.1 immunoglobulin heavy chain junction region [Macaca mulatta]